MRFLFLLEVWVRQGCVEGGGKHPLRERQGQKRAGWLRRHRGLPSSFLPACPPALSPSSHGHAPRHSMTWVGLAWRTGWSPPSLPFLVQGRLPARPAHLPRDAFRGDGRTDGRRPSVRSFVVPNVGRSVGRSIRAPPLAGRGTGRESDGAASRRDTPQTPRRGGGGGGFGLAFTFIENVRWREGSH